MTTARTILVVDDEADTRATLREALEDGGFAVVEAANARKALGYLGSAGAPIPSVILADLRMGEISGIQLAQTVKSYARFDRVPVVIVSGIPQSRELPPEISAYLEKPLSLDVLLRTIEATLNLPVPCSPT